MTPRCTNCLHWDEGEADEKGRAPCLPLTLALNKGELVSYMTDYDTISEVRTRGDFGCALCEPKRVTPAPTHPSSEAVKP